MDSDTLRRLKELERENTQLKRMFANLSLDHHILKDVIEKKL
jgi:putative transposase